MGNNDNNEIKTMNLAPNCKLTPEVQEIICDHISKGNYVARACEAAGISRTTFYNWLQLAEQGNQPYLDLFNTFKKAEAQASVERIARIQEAAKGGAVVRTKTTTRKDGSVEVSEDYAPSQWTADAWTSERKEPQEWGRVQRIEARVEMSPQTKAYLERHAEAAKRLQEAIVLEVGVVDAEFKELPETNTGD